MQAALDGITVLDLATVGPAPRATRILADYGARVVKVGAPPKRAGAQIEPVWWAYAAQRGMRRIRLDLKAEAGREAFLRLVAGADVVVESFRPGVAARLGVGFEACRAANPAIVYCATSGYGQSGPRAGWAGHDLDYLAVSGFLHVSGRRADGGPALPGATLADAAGGGMHAALAILAALLRRAKSGEGGFLDVSVADGMLQLMSLAVDEQLATGVAPEPGHGLLTGRYACYDVYAARDGRWLAVAAIEPRFWANLCGALGLERFVPHQHDDALQEEIRAALRAAFAERPRDEWIARLAPADTCVAPVQSAAEIAVDPHYAARGALREARHPEHGRFQQLAPLLAGAAPAAEIPDPRSSDARALLAAAGLEAGEIERLEREGVVA